MLNISAKKLNHSSSTESQMSLWFLNSDGSSVGINSANSQHLKVAVRPMRFWNLLRYYFFIIFSCQKTIWGVWCLAIIWTLMLWVMLVLVFKLFGFSFFVTSGATFIVTLVPCFSWLNLEKELRKHVRNFS